MYKGVPFAEPPVGELRWREPRPAARWSGVLEAHNYAPACMQLGVSMPGEPPHPVSEDCLYLNVFKPAGNRDHRLPVMVWIYGGGFTNGATSLPLYSGERLARKGVVVVSVAYRVGPLGFLAHPELTSESFYGTSGNSGLMDQIAALQWVGGEKDNRELRAGGPSASAVV